MSVSCHRGSGWIHKEGLILNTYIVYFGITLIRNLCLNFVSEHMSMQLLCKDRLEMWTHPLRHIHNVKPSICYFWFLLLELKSVICGDSCRSHLERNKNKIIIHCKHSVVNTASKHALIFPGWNLKRSTAQPSRAGVLRSTTPSTLQQVWACSKEPAQTCCWHEDIMSFLSSPSAMHATT